MDHRRKSTGRGRGSTLSPAPSPASASGRAAAALALLLLSGCGAGSERQNPADTAKAQPTVKPGPEASFPADVRAACDSAADRWSAMPGASVQRGDTLLDPGDQLPDFAGDSLVTTRAGERLVACVVTGWHPAGLDDTARKRLFWPAAGWGTLWRIGADGPDGQVLTYQRGLVRCQVSDEWDGGDDSDSTYVPDPFFRQVVRCWRHDRELVPADTLPVQ